MNGAFGIEEPGLEVGELEFDELAELSIAEPALSLEDFGAD